MSVEASGRKYLDALAQKAALLYDFDLRYKRPTMGDVFAALDNNDFGFQERKGRRMTQIPLPSLFSDAEWAELRQMNRDTTDRIHDGSLPTTSTGKKFIVLPHSQFSDER